MNTDNRTGAIEHSNRHKRLKEARAILEQGLDHVREDPEALAAYLRFRAHFRAYSHHNTMLLITQRPSARYCMGFRQWQRHGRYVRTGEKGLMIFAPILRRRAKGENLAHEGSEAAEDYDGAACSVAGFRVAYVWDFTQTEVIPGQEDTALQYASLIPRLCGDDYVHLLHNLSAVAERLGFRVERYADRLEEGYCSFARRVIGIRADHSPNDAAAILAHELAHAVAHEQAEGLSHAAAELQAEGAAYLVCYALGLDTAKAALPYLKHYTDSDEELFDQIEMIERIAFTLVDAVDLVRRSQSVLIG